MILAKQEGTPRLVIGDSGIKLDLIHVLVDGDIVFTWNDHGNIYIKHNLVLHQIHKLEVFGNYFWEIKPACLSEHLGKRSVFIIMKGTKLADLYIPDYCINYECDYFEGRTENTIKTNIIILDPYEKLIRTRTNCKNNKYETNETVA